MKPKVYRKPEDDITQITHRDKLTHILSIKERPEGRRGMLVQVLNLK